MTSSLITILTPVYNEEKNIIELYSRINKVFTNLNKKYELLFVDNGSKDQSLQIIRKLSKEHTNVRYISLTKNFGHQGGIWAGLYNTNNTCVVMDADLQHPPEAIPEMIKKWEEGYKIVNTQKKMDFDVRIWKKIFSRFFYALINILTNLNLKPGQSDFCLIDFSILEIIKNLPERKNFLRGILSSLGFDSGIVKYSSKPRKEGKSKFSFWEYLNFSFDGIISFSSFPITLFFWTGIFIAFLCLSYLLYIIVILVKNFISIDSDLNLFNWLMYGNVQGIFPPGWASLIVAILFMGSIQLIGLGILGKYISLTLDNVKKRPEFFIKEKSD